MAGGLLPVLLPEGGLAQGGQRQDAGAGALDLLDQGERFFEVGPGLFAVARFVEHGAQVAVRHEELGLVAGALGQLDRPCGGGRAPPRIRRSCPARRPASRARPAHRWGSRDRERAAARGSRRPRASSMRPTMSWARPRLVSDSASLIKAAGVAVALDRLLQVRQPLLVLRRCPRSGCRRFMSIDASPRRSPISRQIFSDSCIVSRTFSPSPMAGRTSDRACSVLASPRPVGDLASALRAPRASGRRTPSGRRFRNVDHAQGVVTRRLPLPVARLARQTEPGLRPPGPRCRSRSRTSTCPPAARAPWRAGPARPFAPRRPWPSRGRASGPCGSRAARSTPTASCRWRSVCREGASANSSATFSRKGALKLAWKLVARWSRALSRNGAASMARSAGEGGAAGRRRSRRRLVPGFEQRVGDEVVVLRAQRRRDGSRRSPRRAGAGRNGRWSYPSWRAAGACVRGRRGAARSR